MSQRKTTAAMLVTPHISLGSTLTETLKLLRAYASPTEDKDGLEHFYLIDTGDFRVAVYPESTTVKSVLYDDPLGRGNSKLLDTKIELYLARYGLMKNWDLRMDNGWMRYWFNPTDGVSMVYGAENDVIRFNIFAASPN